MRQQLWGYKFEGKIYLGVRERKRLNITAVGKEWVKADALDNVVVKCILKNLYDEDSNYPYLRI